MSTPVLAHTNAQLIIVQLADLQKRFRSWFPTDGGPRARGNERPCGQRYICVAPAVDR